MMDHVLLVGPNTELLQCSFQVHPEVMALASPVSSTLPRRPMLVKPRWSVWQIATFGRTMVGNVGLQQGLGLFVPSILEK